MITLRRRGVPCLGSVAGQRLRSSTLQLILTAGLAGSANGQGRVAKDGEGLSDVLPKPERSTLGHYEYLGEIDYMYMPCEEGMKWITVTLEPTITLDELGQLIDLGSVRLLQPILPVDTIMDDSIFMPLTPTNHRPRP